MHQNCHFFKIFFKISLCAGQIPLQFDGFKLVTRPHHNFRFCADVRARGYGKTELHVFKRSAKFRDSRFNITDVRYNSARGNDNVGTACVLGLQPVQSFAVIESVGSSARVIKSESEKTNERFELIHRKTNYHR